MRRPVEQKYHLLSLFIGVAGNGVLSSWKESCKCRRQWVPYCGSQSLWSSLCCCLLPPCVYLGTAFFPQTLVILGAELGKMLSQILHHFCSPVSVTEVLTVWVDGNVKDCDNWCYLWELDTGCGILLLKRWFLKVFLHPKVNGLTQDELSQTSDDFSI